MPLDYITIIAAGSFNGVGGAPGAAFGERGGVCIRTGAGAYQITLDKGYDVSEGIIIASLKATAGAAAGTIRTATTSDTVKTVTAETVGGVAGPLEVDFDWIAVRFAP